MYCGTSGSASIGGSFGGSASDCSLSQQGITVDRSYWIGTRNGSFAFFAESLTGGATHEQPTLTSSGCAAMRLLSP